MKDSSKINNFIIELFEELYQEFDFQENNPKMFPHKESFLDNSGRYVNMLSGKLSDGMVGNKTIFVDEAKHILDSTTIALFPHEDKMISVDSGFLTVFRCALVAAYTLYKGDRLGTKIGFVGGGRINLMTAYIISFLGADDIVVLGGRHNESKNEQCFSTITGKKVLTGRENIQKCDTLVVCTNNNEQKDLITKEDARKAYFVVSFDGGFTLDKDWRRDFINFSDYPKQLEAKFLEEFPYDGRKSFRNPLFHINMMRKATEKVGVYLYGTIVADLIVFKAYKKKNDLVNVLMTEYNKVAKGLKN